MPLTTPSRAPSRRSRTNKTLPRRRVRDIEKLANAAIAAFEVLRTGNVGVAGSTGSIVLRNLMAIRAGLVDRPPVTIAAAVNRNEREVEVESK